MGAVIYHRQSGFILQKCSSGGTDDIALYLLQVPDDDHAMLVVDDEHPVMQDETKFCINNGDLVPKTVLSWTLTPSEPVEDQPFEASLSPTPSQVWVYISTTLAYFDEELLTADDATIEFPGFEEPCTVTLALASNPLYYADIFSFEVNDAEG